LPLGLGPARETLRFKRVAQGPLSGSPIGCAPGEEGNEEQVPLTFGINPTIRKIASIARKRW
jgi:hypothetical protein